MKNLLNACIVKGPSRSKEIEIGIRINRCAKRNDVNDLLLFKFEKNNFLFEVEITELIYYNSM